MLGIQRIYSRTRTCNTSPESSTDMARTEIDPVISIWSVIIGSINSNTIFMSGKDTLLSDSFVTQQLEERYMGSNINCSGGCENRSLNMMTILMIFLVLFQRPVLIR